MTAPKTRNDDLLRPAEVAQMLGVHPKTVTRWAAQGRLRATRTAGGHRRYKLVDVLALKRAAEAGWGL